MTTRTGAREEEECFYRPFILPRYTSSPANSSSIAGAGFMTRRRFHDPSSIASYLPDKSFGYDVWYIGGLAVEGAIGWQLRRAAHWQCDK